ncbi:hypothetical protein [Microcoleus vaginatus]|uniref:hypothetical protein n=1 Tax=Microcoleus vaginatus TaxID=119532 RepID=UPI001F60358A
MIRNYDATDINSGAAGMISNPRFIAERKVELSCQQIIRAIFSFLTHSQQSTVNSQQSTVNNNGRCNGIDMTYRLALSES